MEYAEYLDKKKDYQKYGSLFLLEQKHACLFYKAGKGKTYPTIDAIREVDKMKNGQAKVLIMSTADAIHKMWENEILPQNILPKKTVLISFSSAIQDDTKLRLLGIDWDVIVIDESHKIKSHNSQISKLVYRLSKKTEYVWGLSGTPRGNTDVDIFCQFHNMNISAWGDISYTYFIDNLCDIDMKFARGGIPIKTPTGISKKYKVGWEKNIAQFSQRVDYDEDDNMPDLSVNLVELDYEKTKEYKDAEQGVLQLSEYETTMTKLAAIQKLHQAVNGFLYFPDPTDEKKKLTYQIEGENKKLQWLKDNVTDEPTLIVYKFAEDLNKIASLGFDYTEDIDDFKEGKHKVLLLQCSRCESFNLQMCNRIIFYTMDYSYICYDQMLHRVWRMGQEQNVKIDILTYKNTIETKIWNTVHNKETLANLFMSIKGE